MSVQELILKILESLSDEQRGTFFGIIHSHYCTHCYSKHPAHGTCQCWDDE